MILQLYWRHNLERREATLSQPQFDIIVGCVTQSLYCFGPFWSEQRKSLKQCNAYSGIDAQCLRDMPCRSLRILRVCRIWTGRIWCRVFRCVEICRCTGRRWRLWLLGRLLRVCLTWWRCARQLERSESNRRKRHIESKVKESRSLSTICAMSRIKCR